LGRAHSEGAERGRPLRRPRGSPAGVRRRPGRGESGRRRPARRPCRPDSGCDVEPSVRHGRGAAVPARPGAEDHRRHAGRRRRRGRTGVTHRPCRGERRFPQGGAACGREADPARARPPEGEAASCRSRGLAAPWRPTGRAGRDAGAGAPILDTRDERRQATAPAARRFASAAPGPDSLRSSLHSASVCRSHLGGRCLGRRVTRAPAPRRARRSRPVLRPGGRDPTGPAASTAEAASDRPPNLATRLNTPDRSIRRPERAVS